MKKIMFNSKYGLEQAVLEGRKTMTRRIIHDDVVKKSAPEAINEKPVDNVDKVSQSFKPGDWVIRKNGATFSNGSICARVRNIEGHKVWFEHGTYADEAYLVKIKEPKYE